MKQLAFAFLCFWRGSSLARSTSSLFIFFAFNRGVSNWSDSHSVLICFANLIRCGIDLSLLSRVATESDPRKKKLRKITLGTGILWQNPPVLFTPPNHPPVPHPSSSPEAACKAASGGFSLSLSLLLSNDSAWRGASASGVGSHGPAGTEDLIGTRSVGEEGSVCHS